MFNKSENSYLKMAMKNVARDDDNMLKKRHEGNIYPEHEVYCHGKPRIDIMFPILDPDLEEDERLKAHKTWFNVPNPYLEDWESEDQKTEFKLEGKPVEYANRSPMLYCFLPTDEIMEKLIKRATQLSIYNIDIELNPKEHKMDPKVHKKEREVHHEKVEEKR